MVLTRRFALAPPLLLACAVLLAACGGTAAAPAMAPTGAPAAAEPMAAAPASTAAPAAEPTAAAAQQNSAGGAVGAQPQAQGTPGPSVPGNDPSRKIIKDATLSLEVASVDLALSRVSGIAAQSGGYILETRTDNIQENQKQGLIKLAVPVDQFEAVLQRLREGANRIVSEQASGVDATQEYVDVQSQIANLEATQARIRQFLDQAKTVEESLQVNAQLTEIEGQISQLKGRLQFLSQRAAYSTITVQLQEPPPPTPTPTVTPTPTNTPTPEPLWNPQQTTAQASSTLVSIVQALATIAIWLVIVVLPLALPVVLIVALVRWLMRRQSHGRSHTVPPRDAP